MAAIAVGITSTVLIANTVNDNQDVTVQNRGPNSIYVEVGGAAVIATSIEVTSGAVWMFRHPALTSLNAICSVLQVTPLDTRVMVT